MHTMKDLIEKLMNRQDLVPDEVSWVFTEMMRGQNDQTQIAGFLVALRMKKETSLEFKTAVNTLIELATPFPSAQDDFIDIVGTGGDHSHSINISTASAILLAAAGYKVIKHGNRSVSSLSGSSNVLQAMGIEIEKQPHVSKEIYDELGLCFLHAPIYHGSFKHVAEVRKALQVHTIFNLLGPLLNPAKPRKTMIGVYSSDLLKLYIETLRDLHYERALVVHGSGTDECAIHGVTQVAELQNGKIRYFELTPDDFGLETQSLASIQGGDAKTNSDLIMNVFKGIGKEAHKNVIAMNAALASSLWDKKDLKKNTEDYLGLLDSGKVFDYLQTYIKRSQND